jgi:hypothetical protein
MTTAMDARRSTALRRAAVRATLAPSVHNTQPWALRLRGERLDLYGDRERQLTILDPTGRQLTIGCGAALLNARVSLAASGFDARIDRFPGHQGREVLARITIVGDQRPHMHSRVSLGSPASPAMLDSFVDTRRTNGGPFTGNDIPVDVLTTLGRAVTAEQAEFFVVRRADHRAAVDALSTSAQAATDANPSYRSEARAWAEDDVRRSTQAQSSPALASDADDDRAGQCLVIVGSVDDRPLDWLKSGEAIERMLLETTRQGFVAGPLAQSIVTTADRRALRDELGLTMTPQLVVRIGRAPASLATRRRRLVDVLLEDV